MTESKKWKGWIIVTIFAVIITVGIFFQPTKLVSTTDYEHEMVVLWRVRKEIMQQSPAGRYYEALMWKHSDDLDAILTPEKIKERMRITRMFIPGLEALLDGKGDTVWITEEQVNSLKEELDWMASVGSLSLREDIEKEQQRFPLDRFVGMTMSEALDYINSNFPPGLTAESITPTATITKIPQPTRTPICMTGPDSSCLTESLLVHNSNGEWAYYVYNDVYFEYPSAWYIRQNNAEELLIFPTQESPEGMKLGLLALMFPSNVLIDNWDQVLADQFLAGPQSPWSRPGTEWKRIIRLTDFQGFECFWRSPDALGPYLEFFLYNENHQTAVGFLAQIEDDNVIALMDNPDAANEIFPNIQHIIKSIQFWEPYDQVDVYGHGFKFP